MLTERVEIELREQIAALERRVDELTEQLAGGAEAAPLPPQVDGDNAGELPTYEHDTRVVRFLGRCCRLGINEGLVFGELHRRAQRHVSHQELHDLLWGECAEKGERTLEGTISRIRGKLRRHGMAGVATAINGRIFKSNGPGYTLLRIHLEENSPS